MARAYCFDVLQDADGQILVGATVEIREPGTSTPISEDIYLISSGGSPTSQPLATDARGAVSFYLDSKKDVDLYYEYGGMASATRSNVPVLPAMADLLDLTTAQTLSNKTLSSPTINTPAIAGGTWDSPTINGPTFSGQGKFARGTVGAPGMAFGVDLDTGIWSEADDTLDAAVGAVKGWKTSKTNSVFARTTFGTADFPASLSGDAYEFQTAQPSLMAVIDRESGADKIAGPAMTIFTDKYAPMNDGVASGLGIWARRAWNDTGLSQAMQAVDVHAQQVAGYRGNIAGWYTRALGRESWATSTQSAATYTVSGGAVTGTTITTPGAGYATAPSIDGSGVGETTATFRAVMTDGVLTGITVTNSASSKANGTYSLTISGPSGGSVFGAVLFAGEAGGGHAPEYLETVGLEINPYRETANASTDYSLSTVPGSQVGRSIGLNLIATGTKKHTAALVVDSHDHTNGNYYTGIDFIQGGIDATTRRAIRLPNGGKIVSRLAGGGEAPLIYANTSDHTILNAATGKEARVYVNDTTLVASFASGAVNVTGTLGATGAVSGASVAATGAVTGASVAATGAVTGATATTTGATTANSVNVNTTGAAAGEVKTSSHIKAGGRLYPGNQTAKYLTMVASQAVAAGATVNLGAVLGTYAFFDEDTDGAPSLVWLRGSGATVTSISTPDTAAWNINSDAGSRWAVYWSVNAYFVKNRAATSKSFSYTILTSN